MIGHDEMLLGLYHHVQQQNYGHALWELIGIRKADWLQEYISTSYTDSPLQSLQGNQHQLMIEHSLQQALFADNQQSLVELLLLSWKGVSDELKTYLKSKKLPYQKVQKRIGQVNDLLKELEMPMNELMDQFAIIKNQYDIKLYEVDLEFLLNDDGEDDIGAILQQMIGLGDQSDYGVSNNDDTDLLEHDEDDTSDNKSTSAVA